MRYKTDHDYHIHSHLSLCSGDPEQNTEAILEYARKNKLSSICITDHYWDSTVEGASSWYAKQNFEHISLSLPLPQAEGIRFMFGCEGEMNKQMNISVPSSRFDDFDFIIIPTTHLHMSNNIEAEHKDDFRKKAELWVERFDALLDMPLPFHKLGVAHPVCSLLHKASREEYIAMLDLIPSSELERIFWRAAKLGCGIELNADDMAFSDSEADSILRFFRIAKSCGCKFYLGSDAHSPNELYDSTEIFERAITLLDLKESDKFHISK